MEDLNRAIEISRGKGNSGCQAFCQRALLHRRNGRDDEAKADFTRAAQLGSSFARQQVNYDKENLENGFERNGTSGIQKPFNGFKDLKTVELSLLRAALLIAICPVW